MDLKDSRKELFAELPQIADDIFHRAIEQHAVLEWYRASLLQVVGEILARFLHDLKSEAIDENEDVGNFDFGRELAAQNFAARLSS